MPRADVIDISHHNTITSYGAIPRYRAIVHKITEGRTAVDRRWRERWPALREVTDLLGAYHVIHASDRRQQRDHFLSQLGDRWRDGVFAMIDWEPWEGYPVATAEHVLELEELMAEAVGPGRVTVYANPNQLGREFDRWRDASSAPLWLPHYGTAGPTEARRRGAMCHQWTDRYPSPGFTAGIDANELLDPTALARIARRERDPMDLITDLRHFYDTRATASPMGKGERRRIDLGPEVAGARAVTVNVVAIAPATDGHLHAHGAIITDQSRLNYRRGVTTSTELMVPLDGSAVWVFSSAPCDLLVNRVAVWR